MNYNKLYYTIIETARNTSCDTYTERHHIIPRCLGGSDDNANLVKLTAKEHFVCHLLLTKMYPEGSNEWHKMIKAFMMMCCHSGTHSRYTGRIHENYRKHFSQVQSKLQTGINNSNYGTMWIHNMTLEKSIKISNRDPIPGGWIKGRVIDFDIKRDKIKQLEARKIRIERKQKTQIETYTALYDEYVTGKWSSIRDYCRNSEYSKSHVHLTKMWKKYVPEYARTVKPNRAYRI